MGRKRKADVAAEDYSRETLRHVAFCFGPELRWNGIRGAIAAYRPNTDEILKTWTAEQNKDGQALQEAIGWAKKWDAQAKPTPPPED